MITTINGREARVTVRVDEGNIDLTINGLYICGIRRTDGTLVRYEGMTPGKSADSTSGLTIDTDGRIKLVEAK